MSDVSTITSSTGISSISRTLTTPAPAASSDAGDDSNENFSSGPSASLYLYTFLATLILLLCISSAIVLRTLVLRRRHRRLVEEAIRNGTLIPPSPSARDTFVRHGRSGRKQIDLSKKPKMWEAVMEELDVKVKGEMNQWDWDLIKPFSATAVGDFVSEPVDAASPRSERAGTTGSTPHDRLTFTTQHVLQLFDGTAPPLSPIPGPGLSNNDTDSNPEVNEAGLRSRPHKVRAAVLIAMPSRSTSRSRPRCNAAMPNRTLSPTGSPLPPIAEPPPLGLPQVVDEKEIEQLPYLEFGIVDLEVRQDQDRRDIVDQQEDHKRTGSTVSCSDAE